MIRSKYPLYTQFMWPPPITIKTLEGLEGWTPTRIISDFYKCSACSNSHRRDVTGQRLLRSCGPPRWHQPTQIPALIFFSLIIQYKPHIHKPDNQVLFHAHIIPISHPPHLKLKIENWLPNFWKRKMISNLVFELCFVTTYQFEGLFTLHKFNLVLRWPFGFDWFHDVMNLHNIMLLRV